MTKKRSVTEVQIHEAVSGIPFPANKDDIIEYARVRSGTDGVVDMLNELPNQEYSNEPHLLSTLKEYMGH